MPKFLSGHPNACEHSCVCKGVETTLTIRRSAVSDTGSAARSDRFEELLRRITAASTSSPCAWRWRATTRPIWCRKPSCARLDRGARFHPVMQQNAGSSASWSTCVATVIAVASIGACGETRSPEEAVTAHEAVHAALARLPARRRAVVVLRELEERDTADVAALLGMRAVTVRWHLSQGRKQLRSLLDGEEGRR